MKPVFDENGLAAQAGDVRCFYYDASTSEYTGWSDEYINVGVSMPGYSTDIDPGDEVPGEVSIFTGEVWRQEEDHRGETVYSTENAIPSTIDYIGPVHDGYTAIAPSTPYDKWDGDKWVTDTDELAASRVLENTHQKAALIFEATNLIAPLVDARDGGYIDDADVPVLSAWQKYRYALTKVDPSKPVSPERPKS